MSYRLEAMFGGCSFDGIKKLPAEQVGMKMGLLLQWIAESQM